jgi:Polysaccharide lyase
MVLFGGRSAGADLAPPTAAYTYNPATPVTESPTTFDGSRSTCAATPCTYTWEDDGPDGPGRTQSPLGTGQVIQFTFHGGAFTAYVRLTVRDAQGRTATTVKTLQVGDGRTTGQLPIDGSFENGLTGWNTAGVGDYVPPVVTDSARNGTHSAKVLLTASQNRSELILSANGTSSNAGTKYFVDGADYWYGFSMRVLSMVYGHPGAHNVITQFHPTPEATYGSHEYFELSLWDYNGKKGLYCSGRACTHSGQSCCDQYIAPFPQNQWNDVQVHFHAGQNGNGSYEVWLNGTKVDSNRNVSLFPSGATNFYIKSGLYRNGGRIPGTSELRLDAGKLGTSQQHVRP